MLSKQIQAQFVLDSAADGVVFQAIDAESLTGILSGTLKIDRKKTVQFFRNTLMGLTEKWQKGVLRR